MLDEYGDVIDLKAIGDDDDDDAPNEEYRDENMKSVEEGFGENSGFRTMDEDEMLEDLLGGGMEGESYSESYSADDTDDFDIEPTDEDLLAIEGEDDIELFTEDTE